MGPWQSEGDIQEAEGIVAQREQVSSYHASSALREDVPTEEISPIEGPKPPPIKGIDTLSDALQSLPEDRRQAVERLFAISENHSNCAVPLALRGKVARWFGDDLEEREETVKRIETQRIVRVTNKFTQESALFNPLRAKRPNGKSASQGQNPSGGASRSIESDNSGKEDGSAFSTYKERRLQQRDCDFCKPLDSTCADSWGRVETDLFVTASNIAKADAYHGLLIFKDCHEPLDFLQNASYMRTFLGTFKQWVRRTMMHAAMPKRRSMGKKRRRGEDALRFPSWPDILPVLLWNCAPKAGASQVHCHAQTFVFTEKFGRLAVKARAEEAWQLAYGSDYIDSMVNAHAVLGLAHWFEETEVILISSLTPSKEKELTVVARAPDPLGDNLLLERFGEALHFCLQFLVDRHGVSAFNMAIELPWTEGRPETKEGSSPFIIARIIDRGPPSLPADFASAEIFVAPVVSSDPFLLHHSLLEHAACREVTLTPAYGGP